MILRRSGGRPLVVGHRGAPVSAPPNTLAGLHAAVAAGADIVEFDVGHGLLLGHPGEEPEGPAATLDEALSLLGGEPIGIMVDLKERGIEVEVAAAIRGRVPDDRVLVSSTWAGSMRIVAGVLPGAGRAISYPRDRYGAAGLPWPRAAVAAGAASLRAAMPVRVPILLAAARANAVSLHHVLVSPAAVRSAHRRGAPVVAWTVGDPARIEQLARDGVDAIVSDDPEMALQVLGKLELL
jgi:glycerophosphoryl diester phosphodiesterase